MEIHKVLQEMEEHITNASRIPLTGKVMVDGDLILEFIDKIHVSLPEELKRAQEVLKHSDKLMESMESQGKLILNDAREQADKLVLDTEIYQLALRKGEEIIRQAEANAAALQQDSLIWSDDVLHQLELNLEKVIYSIKQNREDLRKYPVTGGDHSPE